MKSSLFYENETFFKYFLITKSYKVMIILKLSSHLGEFLRKKG